MMRNVLGSSSVITEIMKIPPEQISLLLENIPEWTRDDNELSRAWMFRDFGDAMIFVNRVAELAQQNEHHPDILIRYNKVALTLTTHDANGLTNKDFWLAQQIDDLVSEENHYED
jgi:4a-hydroxytetrahydrobiopterin dehydratase